MNHGLFNQQGNRSGGMDININVSTTDFEEPAPLGSGIVILLGASLGYVALKKKEDEQ